MLEAMRGRDRLFRALADPSRRKILRLLAGRELPLRRIEARFAMSRPAVLKHIRVLQSCRLVRARRSRRETLHRLNAVPLRGVRDWIGFFEGFWDERLGRLKRQIELET